ncbi:MAG: hypothetical protein ACE148_14130 [Vicinamibacterales bacterium]
MMPSRIGLMVAALLLAWAAALGTGLSGATAAYDDAYITFRYARNLVEGQGFVYNPGERLLGTTTPGYALLLAGLSKATGGADPADIANWLSALAISLAAWFAFRLVFEDFGLVAGLTACASTAVNPVILTSWGGEWLLAVAAMAAGFCAYRLERFVLAAVAFSVAILFRSEAAIGAAVVFLHLTWGRRSGAILPIVTSAAIGLVWVAVLIAVTGHVVPSTLASKLAHARSGFFGSLPAGLYTGAKAFVRADPRMIAVALLAWHGALLAGVRGGVWWLVGTWVFAHALFYTLLRLPFYHWYIVPVGFALSLAAGVGVAAVALYLASVIRRQMLAGLATFTVVAVLVTASVMAEARSSWHWFNAKPDPRERAYNELGAWLAANTAPDSSVAYLEIGRLGYYSRRRIVDLMGLVTPGVAEHVAQQDTLWAIYEYKPDYYVTNSVFTWAGTVVDEPWFPAAYEPVKVFPGAEVLTVYRKRLEADFPEPPEVEGPQLVHDAIVGEVLPGFTHGQTFTASRDGLMGVALQLATLARSNRGTMNVRIEEVEGGRTILEKAFRMEDVVDNAWRIFRFDAQPASSGRRYAITIDAVDAAPGNAITIWYLTRDGYGGGERLLNGAPVGGDLALKLFYTPRPGPNGSS